MSPKAKLIITSSLIRTEMYEIIQTIEKFQKILERLRDEAVAENADYDKKTLQFSDHLQYWLTDMAEDCMYFQKYLENFHENN